MDNRGNNIPGTAPRGAVLIAKVYTLNKIGYIPMILIFFVTFTLSVSCRNEVISYEDDEIMYKWIVKDQNCFIKGAEARIIVKFNYFIKNKTEKNIWFYDQENGNLWQKIEPLLTNDTIESNYILYKELTYPPPYDYTDPKSIEIKPNDSINGFIEIRYYIFNESNFINMSNIAMQRFNFFILDQDISTHKDDEDTVKIIAENHSKSYTIELPIQLP